MKKLLLISIPVLLICAGLAFYLIRVSSQESITTLSQETIVLLESGNLEGADQILKQLNNLDPEDPGVRLARIYREFLKGEKEPEAFQEELKAIEPNDRFTPAMFYRISRLAMETGNIDLASPFIDHFFQAYPGHPLFHKTVAIQALLQKEYTLALNELEKALDAGLDDVETKLLLARILRESAIISDRLNAKVVYRQLAGDKTAIGFSALLELLGSSTLPRSAEETQYYLKAVIGHPFFKKPDNPFLSDPVFAGPLARSLASSFPGDALFVFRQLIDADKATVEDRKLATLLFIQEKQFSQAEMNLEALTDQLEDHPDVQALRVYLLFEKKQFEEAFRALDKISPSSDANSFLLPVIQSVLASKASDLTPSETKRLYRLILDFPRSTPETRIAAWTQIIAREPLYEEDLFREAIQDLEEHPLRLARWLNLNQRFDLTLEILNLEDIQENPESFSPYFAALLGNEQYSRAEEILVSMRSDLREDQYLLARVLYWMSRDNPEEFKEAWDEAYEYSRSLRNSKLLLSLADFAHRLELPERAYRAYKQCFLENYLPELRHWLRAFVYCFPREDLNFLKELSARAHMRYPGNPTLVNNLAYLHFLEDQNVDAYVSQMEEIQESYPDELIFRLTLGMGYLRQNQEEKALALIRNVNVNWSQESNRSQMIIAAILVANDQVAIAGSFISQLDTESFLQEEKEFYDSYFSSFTNN